MGTPIGPELEAVLTELRGGDFKLCPRCRCCEMEWELCERCDGEGTTAPGELYEHDPLWYDPDDEEPCPDCNGEAGWWRCLGDCDENGLHKKAG